jgi:LacI family transcriptional regulator
METTRPKRRIAVMVPVEYEYSRQMVLGAAKYCVSHHMSIMHLGVNADILAELPRIGVSGVMGMLVDPTIVAELKKLKIPAINTSSRLNDVGLPTVVPDHFEIGRQACKHLLERGFRNLAYCGMAQHHYSVARAEGFAAAAKEAKVNFQVLESEDYDLLKVTESRFARLILEMPKPLGVMCANDIRSRHVMEACHVLEMRVPQDVAIIGVDNDLVICQGLDPMLSSVDPNGYRVGYEAAAQLDRLLSGKPVPPMTSVPPLGVVPRASTNTTPSDDARVGKALEFIHSNADRPINVMDVAARVGASRRTLERHFRTTLGKSVASAIRKAHVELAKQLLLDTDLSLEEVAESSGMNYLRQMRIVFTKEVGISPSSFRKQFRGG